MMDTLALAAVAYLERARELDGLILVDT